MNIRSSRIDIHISNFIFALMPLLLFTGLGAEYLVAFASITVHELGHVAAARIRGYRLERISFTPIGLSIAIHEEGLSRLDSLLIFSAGPAVNLLIAALSYGAAGLLHPATGALDFFFYSNICLAVFNLMPAMPLDGGRILRELLAARIGYMAAGKSLRILAFALSTAFIALGAYQLADGRMNFSLFIIGFYILVLFFTGKMEAALMNIKQIVYRRSRLLKKGVYPARDLVAMSSTPVSEILKSLDFDRFHFIFVLDEKLKLVGIFNENEVMEGIVGGSADITFGELLKIMGKGKLIDI
jgi:stage IV sporulation protein FB